MARHQIGVPKLLGEIDPKARIMSQSTLQRFVSGTHRTSDEIVDACRSFLEEAGVPAEPEFGEALLEFMQPPTGSADKDGVPDSLVDKFVGTFETRIQPADRGRDNALSA